MDRLGLGSRWGKAESACVSSRHHRCTGSLPLILGTVLWHTAHYTWCWYGRPNKKEEMGMNKVVTVIQEQTNVLKQQSEQVIDQQGDFWVVFCLSFKASPSPKSFIWKFEFIYMWIKLISIWKASHWDSLWNRGEVGNRLLNNQLHRIMTLTSHVSPDLGPGTMRQGNR